MEEVISVYKDYSNFEKIKKDSEYQLRFKEEEIEEIKQELKRLDNCDSQSLDQLHQEKIKHSSELSSIEDEFEHQKRKLLEQIRGLEYELEINYKVTKNIITEKILLDFYKFDYEEKIEKLKLDLKRNKILLKDPPNKLATGNYHFRNRKVIIQMKNQVEEVENEKKSAIKIKKNLEEEFFELQDKLDEVTQLKQSTDKKYFEI